jgi:hypothetical protein
MANIVRLNVVPLIKGEVVAKGYENYGYKMVPSTVRTWAVPFKLSLNRLDTGLEYEVSNPFYQKGSTEPKTILLARVMERKMGLREGELAPHSSFWDTYKIKLENKTMLLDLDNPKEELIYHVCKVLPVVASSLSEALDNRSEKDALFYIEDPVAEAEKEEKEQELLAEAITIFTELTPERRRNLSWVLGLPTDNQKDIVVKKNLFTYCQKNPSKFIAATKLNETRVAIEAMVRKAIEKGVIRRKNDRFYRVMPDNSEGVILGMDISGIVTTLSSPKNADLLEQIDIDCNR